MPDDEDPEMSEEKYEAVPDYDRACENCGHKPTVALMKRGKLVRKTGLCGACTWGEAACLFPENW